MLKRSVPHRKSLLEDLQAETDQIYYLRAALIDIRELITAVLSDVDDAEVFKRKKAALAKRRSSKPKAERSRKHSA